MNYEPGTFMMRILIAEDEDATAETLKVLLEKGSHLVTVSRSGEEGLERLRNERFDLVVTDLLMDHGTGFDVLEWIRTNRPGLPILICSSYARPESLRPHLAGLHCRVLKKPFQDDDLRELVEDLLQEGGQALPERS